MKPIILKLSAFVFTAATLSACANTSAPSMTQAHTLNQYHWQLQSANGAQQTTLADFYAGQQQPNLQVDFNEGRLHIYGACNRISGAYQIFGSVIQSSRLMSTLIGCPENLAKQDQALSQFFDQQNLQYQLKTEQDVPMLTLRNRQGQVLNFQGKPTAQTQYGNQVETIFLEVSHQTKTCSDGNRQMQCLQVKEVRYNDQGIKTYTAPNWSHFYDRIEGYTHRPDTDNILRVKRYTLQNPPADASKYAYVLDLVVMQASVR